MKVAAYCRVSTEGEDQANSFHSQICFFEEHIRSHPGWELFRIYADEGLSGTEAKKRLQFQNMLEDARRGEFQLLLTKEVSRFSRNLLDAIAYTRRLRSLGVGVMFLNDNICSLDPDAELRLSIMASLAQEESRRISQRVLWGQARQMERGVVFGPAPFGYRIQNGQLFVREEEAELVRLIFQKYAWEGMGIRPLCRYLKAQGFRSPRGNGEWSSNSLLKILKNEKYVGDLVQRKSYTVDFLSHKKKRNRGEVPLVVFREHHMPILDRPLWEAAQRKLEMGAGRVKKKERNAQSLALSGRIRCGCCGSPFVARKRYDQRSEVFRYWRCGLAVRKGAENGCGVGRSLREDRAFSLFSEALSALDLDRDGLIREILLLFEEAAQSETGGKKEMQRKLLRVTKKRERLVECFCEGQIRREDFEKMEARCREEAERLEKSLVKKDRTPLFGKKLAEMLDLLLRGERKSESLLHCLLEEIRVFSEGKAELRLKNLERTFYFRL